MDLRRIAARIAAGPAKAYRIITDEPVGLAVGFVPEGFEHEEMDLGSDDGGSYVYIESSPGGGMRAVISKDPHRPGSDPEWPEPDLLVFRSPSELAEWAEEYGDGPGAPGEPGMTVVFIGAEFQGVSLDEAIGRMKDLIGKEGYRTGKFELVQDEPNWFVGNLEVEERFWDDFGGEGWEGGDDSVRVTMDVP